MADLPDFPLYAARDSGINLEIEDLAERIVASTSFSPKHPSIVIMEGVSVYLDAATNGRVLASLRRLLQHPRSRLVLDTVSDEVASGSTSFPDLRNFVEGIRELGEPFLFGVSDPAEYFQRHYYRIDAQIPSNYYRRESPDELYAVYNFFVVSPLVDEAIDQRPGIQPCP